MISGNVLVIGGKTSLTFFLQTFLIILKNVYSFGFPGTCNDILTLNFCIFYAKYNIYITKLSNSNKIDFLNFLTYLKQNINFEKQIFSTKGRNEAFDSSFLLVAHF